MAETTELVARLRANPRVNIFDLCDEAADALERLSAPVDGMETTEEERAKVKAAEAGITLRRGDIPGTVLAILRDFARLQAEVERLRAAHEICEAHRRYAALDRTWMAAEQRISDEVDRAEAAEASAARLRKAVERGVADIIEEAQRGSKYNSERTPDQPRDCHNYFALIIQAAHRLTAALQAEPGDTT